MAWQQGRTGRRRSRRRSRQRTWPHTRMVTANGTRKHKVTTHMCINMQLLRMLSCLSICACACQATPTEDASMGDVRVVSPGPRLSMGGPRPYAGGGPPYGMPRRSISMRLMMPICVRHTRHRYSGIMTLRVLPGLACPAAARMTHGTETSAWLGHAGRPPTPGRGAALRGGWGTTGAASSCPLRPCGSHRRGRTPRLEQRPSLRARAAPRARPAARGRAP